MRRNTALLIGLLVVAVAACGDGGTEVGTGDGGNASTAPGAAVPAPGETRYRGTFTVLESPDHGPQLCSFVATSMPPQCGGPDVHGWDWDDVEGASSDRDTTWGEYEVTGTWDGRALTLTEPPGPPASEPPADDGQFASPCPPPEGGWAPVDPGRTTDATLQEAGAVAESLPTHVAVWVDHDPDGDGTSAHNDPTRLVLNVAVTDDPVGAEAAIRSVWGGALCISEATFTQADLSAVQEQLPDVLGDDHVASGVDSRRNRVLVQVWVATDAVRDELAERFGDAVLLEPLLRPVES